VISDLKKLSLQSQRLKRLHSVWADLKTRADVLEPISPLKEAHLVAVPGECKGGG
jgi:hypothetical protein